MKRITVVKLGVYCGGVSGSGCLEIVVRNDLAIFTNMRIATFRQM